MKDVHPSDRGNELESASSTDGAGSKPKAPRLSNEQFRRPGGTLPSFRYVSARREWYRRTLGDSAVDFVIAMDNAAVRVDQPEEVDVPQFPSPVSADSPYRMEGAERLGTPQITIAEARAAHPEFGQTRN